jgi:hypothetical protein
MRTRNWRLVIVGIVLVIGAGGFFLFMMSVAARSNDPVAMMRTVGETSGVVFGIGIAMALVGIVGKKV